MQPASQQLDVLDSMAKGCSKNLEAYQKPTGFTPDVVGRAAWDSTEGEQEQDYLRASEPSAAPSWACPPPTHTARQREFQSAESHLIARVILV